MYRELKCNQFLDIVEHQPKDTLQRLHFWLFLTYLVLSFISRTTLTYKNVKTKSKIKPKLKRQRKWKYHRKTKMILKIKKTLRWWCVTSKNWTGSKLKSINSETINTSHLSYLFNIQCRHCRCMLIIIIEFTFITWAKFINKSPPSSCQSKKRLITVTDFILKGSAHVTNAWIRNLTAFRDC